MPEPLLSLENVSLNYGAIEALREVSLTVSEGEIVTLIGSNGAGKTSTLMAISGIVRPRSGRIPLNGHDLAQESPHEIVCCGVVQSPEGRKIFGRLTVKENLELGAYCQANNSGLSADFDRVYDFFPILKERATQLGGTLSGGEQQMLAIGRALMARPKLLLLDEPSMGVAPLIVAKIFEILKALNHDGLSILLVEQNAHLALGIAKRAYVLETGSITLSGASGQIAADERIKEAYLG